MDKEKFVENYYLTMKVSEIAKVLETSEGNVKRIARKLGIRKFKSIPWSEEDITFLKTHYSDKKAEWCAEKLGRGYPAIHQMVRKLGLKAKCNHVYEDVRGYLVDTTDRNNKKYLHRKVMEEVLGRPLRTNEVIHHIDGDKKNNDPSNLQIVTRAEHIRIHRDDLMNGK